MKKDKFNWDEHIKIAHDEKDEPFLVVDRDGYVEVDWPREMSRYISEAVSIFDDWISTPDKPILIPSAGEALIVLFAPKNRVDAIVGDLSERFAEDLEAKGERRAKLLFWARVTRSIGPLLLAKIKRAGWLAVVLEIGRRWIG